MTENERLYWSGMNAMAIIILREIEAEAASESSSYSQDSMQEQAVNQLESEGA